jgi:hypothetical protein
LVERFNFEEVEMKKINPILVYRFVLFNLLSAKMLLAECPCAYGSSDFASVSIIEENPAEGKIVFSVQCYSTCEDGWDTHTHDIPPIFLVYRPGECIDEPYYFSYSTPGWTNYDKYRYCAVFCGGMGQTCACACPPGCGCYNHSYHDYEAEFNHMWGSFEIKAQFKGEIIFERQFEFPENLPNSKLLSINYIGIKDHTGTLVPENATFDVDESLIIEAIGEWSEDPPENWIMAVVQTNGTGDSLVVPMGFISGNYQNAFYRGIVGSGALRQLYPDPEGHFGYFNRDIMTVYGKQNGCDQLEDSATDEAYISVIRIYVKKINFENSHLLCEETGQDPPTRIIWGPHWIMNTTNNKPACYTRNSYINMEVGLISNFAPLHNLNIYVQGHTEIPDLILSTFPKQTNMYYQALELEGVVSQGPLYNNVNFIDYSYNWTVNKTSLRPPQPMNQSGPHKIYTTLQDPVDNIFTIPTNTLGLELVCAEYAQGRSDVHDILNRIMEGIYSENQIIYEPREDFDQHPDPYDLYRYNLGQCNSFARFFLVLSHSVGIWAKKATVFGGKYVDKEEVQDTLYYDIWFNTCEGSPNPNDAFRDYLFTKGLIDPQGHDGGDHNYQCPPNWSFRYHVMAIYLSGSDFIGYDPVFNVRANIYEDYGNWFKYYYTDGHSHDEPPNDPPGYYGHPAGSNPIDILDDTIWRGVPRHYFYHPPLPPSQNSGASKSPALAQINSVNTIRRHSSDGNGQPYCLVELGSFADSLMGNIWWNSSSSSISVGRSRDKKYPGFYLNSPNKRASSGLSHIDRNTLSDLFSELLLSRPYLPENIDFILKYDNVLGDSTRTEFFGRTEIEGAKISIGGWYRKFISIAIYTDFANIDSFLEKAIISFNLPPLDREEVAVYEKGDEFLYSLKDTENMFILRGYLVFISCGDFLTESQPTNNNVKVIELIKYFDEEFMP